MMPIADFAEGYLASWRELLGAIPRTRVDSLPAALRDPAFALCLTDPNGKCSVEFLSRDNHKQIDIQDRTIPAKDQGVQIISMMLEDQLEAGLFPGIDDCTIEPSIVVDQPHIVFQGLAFASEEFNQRFWSQERFYRCTGSPLPFRVEHSGGVTCIRVLYGYELNGIEESKLFEFAKLFGGQGLVPGRGSPTLDVAFSDVAMLLRSGKDQAWQFSFSNALKSMEASIKQGAVLILGSYSPAGRERIAKTQDAQEGFGYRGFTLEESPDVSVQSNMEKAIAGIMCATFVLVIDDEPSGHIAEMSEMLRLRLRPVIVVRSTSEPATNFLEDLIRTDDLFYSPVIGIEPQALAPAIVWAKEKITSQGVKFDAINKWRDKD